MTYRDSSDWHRNRKQSKQNKNVLCAHYTFRFVVLWHYATLHLMLLLIPLFRLLFALCVFSAAKCGPGSSHMYVHFPVSLSLLLSLGWWTHMRWGKLHSVLRRTIHSVSCSEHTFAHDDDVMKQWNHRGQSRAQQKELKPQNKYILCLFNCSVSNIVPFYLRLITLTNEKVRKSCTRGRQGEKYDYDYDSNTVESKATVQHGGNSQGNKW